MPQSLSCVYVHGIFSTKDRFPYLGDDAIREKMHRQLGGISNTMGCPVVTVGGADDHVHILANLGRTVCQSDWIKELKRVSSGRVKQEGPNLTGFSWQGGYGVFSVDRDSLPKVQRYVANQLEHHKRFSFKEEFLKILGEHKVEWDERYIWD